MNNRWIEYSIQVTLKKRLGVFGVRYEQRQTFNFCASSRDDPIALAASNVRGEGERMVQVMSAIPVTTSLSDECRFGSCAECHYLWCQCPHCHSTVQFALEHPELKSLAHVASEEEEMEYV